MSTRAIPAAAWLMVFGAASPALGTPTALFGPGPRSQGLAASGAAQELGVESSSVNPAFLGGERPLVLAGFRAARFDIEGVDGASDGASDALFGFTAPLPINSENWALTLGVIAGAPRDIIVRADLPFAEEQQFPLLTGRAHAIDFSAGAGLRFRALRLGLGLRALAGLDGRAEVESDASGTRTHVRTTLEPALAPVLGLGYALGDDDSVGLVARAPLEARFDVTVRVGAVGSLTLPDLHVAGTAHYDPAELHAEWRHEFGPTALGLGLSYRRWSALESFVGPTVECPEGAACAALPEERVVLSDTLVPRIALERQLSLGAVTAELRAGYFYEASPLPEQRGTANRYDNARHALTLGYGAVFGDGAARLDLSYQHHFLVERTHEKSSDVPSDNPGFPSATVGGSLDVVALALEVSL